MTGAFRPEELAGEARREARMRRRVYPRSDLSPAEAERRIAMMDAIAAHFDEIAKREAEAREPGLFTGKDRHE